MTESGGLGKSESQKDRGDPVIIAKGARGGEKGNTGDPGGETLRALAVHADSVDGVEAGGGGRSNGRSNGADRDRGSWTAVPVCHARVYSTGEEALDASTRQAETLCMGQKQQAREGRGRRERARFR